MRPKGKLKKEIGFSQGERNLDVRFSGYEDTRENSGDNGERVPPVPIPNTEVKPFSADGTWLETARESRSLPDSKKKRSHECGVFSFCPQERFNFRLSQLMCDIVLG